MVSSTVLTLLVIPALRALVKKWLLPTSTGRLDIPAAEPRAVE